MAKVRFAEMTNPEQVTGSLGDLLHGADVFIGVSAARASSPRTTCAPWPPTRSCSPSPTPSRRSDRSWRRDIAAVLATGRSDFPNQINNVLAFPGIFRGALDAGATRITEGMKLAAAKAIAAAVPTDELSRRLHRAVGVRHDRGTAGRRGGRGGGACRRRVPLTSAP